jgi:hypothetical protein
VGSEQGEILHESCGKVVPGQDLERGGDDNSRGLWKPFEKREDARAHVAAVQTCAGRCGAGETVEVIGFGVGESEGASDPGEYLGRGAGCSALFEADVVLGGDVREDGDLLPPKPGGSSPCPGGESDVFGAEPLTAAAKKRCELALIHKRSLRSFRVVDPSTVCACIRFGETATLPI